MCRSVRLVTFMTAALVAADALVNVVRNTSTGPVLGYVDEELRVECYLGIPYAKPPIRQLRFKYPEPMQRWSKPYNATYFRPWCVQFWYSDVYLEQRDQNEDCLYLNIIVPRTSNKSAGGAPYPVLFWVHGGSYQVGGARLFPIESTVRNLVSKGLVFVSINYRLGPIGFLSSIRNGLPGNYGLEDQIAALKWVHENVAKFDGDPTRVTACGESSGAASIGILATSPRSKGLFQSAVMRSGSALSPWAVQSTNTDLNSGRLLEATNCNFSNDSKTLQCVQRVQLEHMKNVWKALADDDLKLIYSQIAPKHNYNHPFMAHTYFTPVVDRYRQEQSIIPVRPKKLIELNAAMPVMIGTTSGECIAYVSWLAFLAENNRLDMKNIEHVAPSFRFRNAEQVKQAIYSFYFGNRLMSNANYTQTLVKIVTDQNIYVPALMEMELYRRRGVPVYAYRFDYVDEKLQGKHFNYALENQSAAHGFDLVYLFQSMSVLDPREVQVNWTTLDTQLTDYLASTLSNFVKRGDPNELGQEAWPPFDVHVGRQMYIGRTNAVERVSFDLLHFWSKTIAIVQRLSLQSNYAFEPLDRDEWDCGDALDTRCCSANGGHFLNYRTAFFAVLTLCLIVLLALGSYCALQTLLRGRKAIVDRQRCQLVT